MHETSTSDILAADQQVSDTAATGGDTNPDRDRGSATGYLGASGSSIAATGDDLTPGHTRAIGRSTANGLAWV